MKTASDALKAHLNGNSQFILCDLYTWTLADGTILRSTSADTALNWNGNAYPAGAPMLERGNTRTVIGIEVDTLDVTAYPAASDLVSGLPFLKAARLGVFDGAWLKIERAFLSASFPPAVIGAIIQFQGRVSDVDVSRTECRFSVKSALELLNVQMPRNLYQAVCLQTLYDGGCGVSRAAYTANGSVTGGGTVSGFQTGLTKENGYYDQGVVTFTSGANAGIKRTVKSYLKSGGAVTFALPLPSAPAVGDAFSITPGCDKTVATCKAKFNNIGRFRGFPYIPVPETAAG